MTNLCYSNRTCSRSEFVYWSSFFASLICILRVMFSELMRLKSKIPPYITDYYKYKTSILLHHELGPLFVSLNLSLVLITDLCHGLLVQQVQFMVLFALHFAFCSNFQLDLFFPLLELY